MRRWIVLVLVMAGSATLQAEPTDGGWKVNGDTLYGSPRAACDKWANTQATAGVRYTIEKVTPSDRPDVQYCWWKNANDKEPAVNWQPVYFEAGVVAPAVTDDKKNQTTTPTKTKVFRGAALARRTTATTAQSDLGPGVYYSFDAQTARSYAIAHFLEDWTALSNDAIEKGTVPPNAIVLEAEIEMVSADVFDFSSGEALTAFEQQLTSNPDVTKVAPTGSKLERMRAGEVNGRVYYLALAGLLRARGKSLGDFKIVIGPDYRHRNAKQLRVSDASLVATLDKNASSRSRPGFPTEEEVRGALVGVEAGIVEKCTPSSKAGACSTWPENAGLVIMLRRGWRSLVYSHTMPAKYKTDGVKGQVATGNHNHLRIGKILIDGAMTQFDLAVQNNPDLGKELFVGTEPKLIERLGRFKQPMVAGGGKALFDAFWAGKPRTQRLSYKPSGEPMW